MYSNYFSKLINARFPECKFKPGLTKKGSLAQKCCANYFSNLQFLFHMTRTAREKKSVQQLLVPSYILYAGKFLNAVSPFAATRFAARLFLTPFRYKLPEREREMDQNSRQERIKVPSINRDIVVYHYGDSPKKILLIHGWSGRGTQLGIMAKAFKEEGYGVVSFDAPGHGKASGKLSMMPFFSEAALYLQQKYGPFDFVIGHSLGGMASLKAVKDGLQAQKMVIIGTANSITHITQDFTRNLNLDQKIAKRMVRYLEKKFRRDLEEYSGAVSANAVKIPTLVIHDRHDVDVPIQSAFEIEQCLENAELLITENLGHRRILGNPEVIEKINKFLSV